MTRSGKSRIMVLGGLGIIVILLLWGIIAGLPGSTDGGQEADRVTLRSRIKDSFTLDDMIRSMERENTGRSSLSPGYAESFSTVAEAPADTAGSGDEIRRIRELIRRNEQELGAGNVTVPPAPAPAAVKEDRQGRQKHGNRKPTASRSRPHAGGSTACGWSGRTKRMWSGPSCIPHRPSWSAQP